MKVRVLRSILDVPAPAWDALAGDDNPFVEHAFLACLERSGSVGSPRTGWLPRHLVMEAPEPAPASPILAAAPFWLRGDSYGEYIFDWSWARAAQNAGLRYYPKLTGAVPFTPATGPRLLVAPPAPSLSPAHPSHPSHLSPDALRAALAAAADALLAAERASSAHWLFLSETDEAALVAAGWLSRASFQFHWENRGWSSFSDFEAALTRRRRHEIRRERRKVRDAGVSVRVIPGPDLQPDEWAALRTFYLSTVRKMGAIPYLTEAFFQEIRAHLAHRVVAVIARRDGRLVAGTLNFRKGPHLYGRYWGCTEEIPALHFECCYYALIEWAIAEKITRFEAGAQGEHKLPRGFLPTLTRSAHRIAHPGLSRAVSDFLAHERAQVEAAILGYMEESPYQ